MASTYTANSGIEKPGSGEQSGTWGTTTNTNFDIIDRVLNGVGAITLSGTTHTLSTSDGYAVRRSLQSSDTGQVRRLARTLSRSARMIRTSCIL